jgi:hypothetical protein
MMTLMGAKERAEERLRRRDLQHAIWYPHCGQGAPVLVSGSALAAIIGAWRCGRVGEVAERLTHERINYSAEFMKIVQLEKLEKVQPERTFSKSGQD